MVIREGIILKKDKNILLEKSQGLWTSVLAVLLGLLVSVIFVVFSSDLGIFHSISLLFESLWLGSFGSKENLIETLVFATPLIFTGIAHSVAFKTGLFNIGVEGQFIVGMISAALMGTLKGIPAIVHIPLVIISGAIAGALWASLPGYLKAKTGSNEVVNTIMMNFIAMYIANYIVSITKSSGSEASPLIEKTAELPRFLGSYYRINLGIFLALIFVFAAYYLLWKTVYGYELRAVGFNLYASEYGGINIKKSIVLSMAISGLIAGFGGAVHISGVQHQAYKLTTFPGFGMDGIAVALVAKSNPIGVIFSAILFGALNLSSGTLMLYGISKSVSYLIQGTVILFIAAEQIYRFIGVKRKKEMLNNE